MYAGWQLLFLDRGTCHTSHLSYSAWRRLDDCNERVRTTAYFDFHASLRNNSQISGHATFFIAKLHVTVLQELDERAVDLPSVHSPSTLQSVAEPHAINTTTTRPNIMRTAVLNVCNTHTLSTIRRSRNGLRRLRGRSGTAFRFFTCLV